MVTKKNAIAREMKTVDRTTGKLGRNRKEGKLQRKRKEKGYNELYLRH